MSTAAPTCYRFSRFELQLDERRLVADSATVHLGAHAFDLLVALVERAGHLVTKDELLARVWPRVVVEANTLQVHVSALRKILGADAIATVQGQGYRFVPDVAEVSARKHNLPYQITSFIGRESEIAQVKGLMATARLLTLTGSGGCGKTRLALRVAGEMLDAYADGGWLVELAPLGDPTLITQTVAKALEVKQQAGKKLLDTLAEWLESRHLLLVLDNAEHLLAACVEFVDLLLRRCARLSILVTSRERLGIAGELTYRVPSLSVPDAKEGLTGGQALACEAVRLFVERARLQRPELDVTSKEALALANICRRLDGIALAIELAAPRIRAMSIEELSRRLDDRFELLTDGSRAALPRHRTLRSLIDWSYTLLEDSEKTVLQRASVFAGGWTLEAAEHVCGGGNLERGRMLDLLTSLADKSLVSAETHDGVTRFDVLETIRHYAQQRLRDSGEETATRGAHAEFFQEMSSQLDEVPGDEARLRMLTLLDRELDNLRAGLAWCEADVSRSVAGLQFVAGLHGFWRDRGDVGEGRSWIARLLAVAPRETTGATHARVHFSAGALAHLQTDFAASEVYFREALSIWRDLGERRQIVRTIGSLGTLAYDGDDLTSARAYFEEALSLAREIDDRRCIGLALLHLGLVAMRAGDLSAAEAFLEESVLVNHDVGKWAVAEASARLGWVRHLQGNNVAARAMLTQAASVDRTFGDRLGLTYALIFLGTVSCEEGDLEAAKAHLREALTLGRALGGRRQLATAFGAAADLSRACFRPFAAVRLFGAEQRLRDDLGVRLFERELSECERKVAAARSALNDDAAFDLAWNEGRSLTLDEAVRYAMEQLQ